MGMRDKVCRLCKHWRINGAGKGLKVCELNQTYSAAEDTCKKFYFVGYIVRVRCSKCDKPLYMLIEKIQQDWLYQNEEATQQLWLWVHSSADKYQFEHSAACKKPKLKSARLVCAECNQDDTVLHPQIIKNFKKMFKESY